MFSPFKQVNAYNAQSKAEYIGFVFHQQDWKHPLYTSSWSWPFEVRRFIMLDGIFNSNSGLSLLFLQSVTNVNKISGFKGKVFRLKYCVLWPRAMAILISCPPVTKPILMNCAILHFISKLLQQRLVCFTESI